MIVLKKYSITEKGKTYCSCDKTDRIFEAWEILGLSKIRIHKNILNI